VAMRPGTARAWLLGLLPLLLLAALLAWIVRTDPVGSLRGGAPPVEDLVFERVTLSDGLIRATVVNNGPDPVRIAQVTVDEAYWSFHQEPPGPLSHLARATVEIPYPWVVGEAHELALVTGTGLTVPYAIDVAVETPRPSGRFFGLFALIGAYVGVLPVALGLLWYPLLRRLGPAGRDFVLALTIGLLVFLFVDTFEAGREAAAELASSYHGLVLFALTALLAYLAIEAFGAWLRGRRTGEEGRAWAAALLVAVGIGLHNFGEGLAVGAAFGLGELALGTLLILGFTLHNTTEGLAIVAPLARTRVSLRSLLVLGLVAGVPTIPGAWLGAFTYSTLWSVVFLAIGAGAIAQVVVQIARGTAGERRLGELLARPAVFFGLLAGFAVMYVTGLVVG